MACNDCSNPGSAPPAGFTPSTGATSGQPTSYGGNTTVQSRQYGATCPTPLTSAQVTRAAYCPDWVVNLFGSYAGKLIIKAGSCLHFLRSAANGWIRYDAATESVSVDSSPPFVSNSPSGTQFGYIAKTVPTIKQRFDEALGVCVSEGTQEVASQVMDTRHDGRLVVANQPVAGELPVLQSADAANQTRFDYLDPLVAEDQPLTTGQDGKGDIGFMVNVPSTRVSGGQPFVTWMYMRMKRLRMLRSQWGEATGTQKTQARQAVFVPVEGGTAGDGALELRFMDAPPSDSAANFPSSKSQDDTLFYNVPSGPAKHPAYGDGWVAYPRGQGAHFALPPTVFYAGAVPASPASATAVGTTTKVVTMSAFDGIPHPDKGVGIMVKITMNLPVVAGISLRVAVDPLSNGTYRELAVGMNQGVAVPQIFFATFAFLPTSFVTGGGDPLTFRFVKVGGVAMTCDIELIAYFL